MDAPALLAVLQQAAADHAGLLWQEQAERAQRDHDRRLREEQDAEYQRSLEAGACALLGGCWGRVCRVKAWGRAARWCA